MSMMLLFGGEVSPAFDLNFLGGMPAGLTYTNSSTTRTYFGSDGLLKTAVANEPIFEYNPTTLALLGMRWEMEQRTNLALWNRDLTNAAWVSTNGTPLKNQVGLDGVSNSASSFTATAGNATCLQSITSASAARVSSFYLKRLTGTGTVNITQDNGTTWTAVTLTSAWQRFQITATLANPVIGIRVVTSGDAVAFDFAQHESGASTASSPIPTTTASVIRQPDVLTATSISPWYRQDEGAVVFEGIQTDTSSSRGFFAFTDGTAANRLYVYTTSGIAACDAWVSGVQTCGLAAGSTPAIGSIIKCAFAYKADSFRGSLNGSSGASDSSGAVPSITALRMGATRHDGLNPFMGYARRFQYYNTRLTNSQIQGLSRV